MQGTWVRSLVQEHPTFHGAIKTVKLLDLHSRSHALQQENPLQWEAQAPQLERAHTWQWRPSSIQFSRVWLFATPWTAACQASLSITNSWSLLKFMSIKSVMLSNHLILCRPLLLLPSQHQGLFQWVSSSHQVAKGLEFQLQHQSFQWIFRTDFL